MKTREVEATEPRKLLMPERGRSVSRRQRPLLRRL
jgi:hypothetical protein